MTREQLRTAIEHRLEENADMIPHAPKCNYCIPGYRDDAVNEVTADIAKTLNLAQEESKG